MNLNWMCIKLWKGKIPIPLFNRKHSYPRPHCRQRQWAKLWSPWMGINKGDIIIEKNRLGYDDKLLLVLVLSPRHLVVFPREHTLFGSVRGISPQQREWLLWWPACGFFTNVSSQPLPIGQIGEITETNLISLIFCSDWEKAHQLM